VTLAAVPFTEVTTSGAAVGAVYGLLALGLVVIYRTTGIMNFAHWGVGLLGVIAYSFLTGKFNLNPVVSVAVSVVASIVAGVLAYRVVFRRVSRGNQIVVILIAVALAQFFTALGQLILGFQQFTALEPWLPVFDVRFLGARLRSTQVFAAVASIGIAFGFLVWFRLSRTGRALRAVAQNREAATLAGIDEVKYSSIAWGIGSALAAFAILMILPHSAGERGGLITTFDLTPLGTLLIPAFGAALVGGLVNMPMSLVGGFIFGLSRELLVLAPKPWSDLRSAIAAVLIVILLLMRTERFFATKQELEALET
jgi:branched-chain amino acid transport system permease protein